MAKCFLNTYFESSTKNIFSNFSEFINNYIKRGQINEIFLQEKLLIISKRIKMSILKMTKVNIEIYFRKMCFWGKWFKSNKLKSKKNGLKKDKIN